MFEEKTIFERSVKGRKGYSLNTREIDHKKVEDYLPENLRRAKNLNLPEVTEFDVVQHFTRLSQQNFAIDTNFYPLGSCTMKYNPRINEEVANLSGFVNVHPLQYQYTAQGSIRLMYELGVLLNAITGMDAVSLQPCAGAQGELTGILMMRAYHEAKGNPRSKVIIPDSAHGTNPSSAQMAGYQVVTVKTDKDGIMNPQAVAEVMDEEVACLMMTNPSTLGVFEKNVKEICDIVHEKGGLVYCDGANFNAIMGQTSIKDLGFDCMHINLHKTFTTPHGGGGPGSGPVVVRECLEPFLPKPVIVQNENKFEFDFNRPQSIGRVRAFYGNFGMFVRAYTYIRELGGKGIQDVSAMAVLNANYVRAKLQEKFSLAYQADTMHEVVFSDKFLKEHKVKTLDFAKRILDYGMHAPTVYFPIMVSGALMIEPTETTNKDTLDEFCEIMLKILDEAKDNPDLLKQAPHHMFRKRLDEVKALKQPKLKASFSESLKS